MIAKRAKLHLSCLRKRESLGLWVFRVRGVGLKENGKACRLRFEGIFSGGGKRSM